MAVERQIIEASEDNPMLVMGIRLIGIVGQPVATYGHAETVPPRQPGQVSGIYSAPVDPLVLDAAIRLLKTLDDPLESKMLGDVSLMKSIFIVELRTRCLLATHVGQQGQIQQISRVVEYLQENLERNVSVETRQLPHSPSGFHKKFRRYASISLQYVKLIRLNRARTFLLEGKHVSEAGYLVGYNSLAQFSREYKRQFREPPSETWQH